MKVTNFYRKPISMFVMISFAILLCVWANQTPAVAAAPAPEKGSAASVQKSENEGTGFFEQEESEPFTKKGKKFPWLIVGAAVVIGAVAVYFLVLNKKYTLTVTLGEGCTGTPAATGNYKKNTVVNYNYTTAASYGNLQVKLDGALVPASGTVTMDKAHTLEVSATFGATVSITSTPSGAKVYEDYVDSGKTTPASFSYTANGSHTYLLRQCGYQDSIKTKNVVMGESYTIDATLAQGILDNFVVPATCWTPYIPSAWTVDEGIYKCNTTLMNWDYNYYGTVFGSSIYTLEVKLREVQGEKYSPISIFLASSTNMNAGNGYLFAYRADGEYSAWKMKNYDLIGDTGSATVIQGWTPSALIKKNLNTWNTMKIVRSGEDYTYFINGYPLVSFTNSEFDPRVVVLTFYCYNELTEVHYDYVTLDIGNAQGLIPAKAPIPSQVPDQKPWEHK